MEFYDGVSHAMEPPLKGRPVFGKAPEGAWDGWKRFESVKGSDPGCFGYGGAVSSMGSNEGHVSLAAWRRCWSSI